MRALRIALVALLSLSVLDASAAFAKGTGGAAGGGAAGGGSGSGAGGAGAGSAPLSRITVLTAVPNDNGHPRHERPRYTPGKEFSACFKQEPLFDRHGNVVANLHGADCFQ